MLQDCASAPNSPADLYYPGHQVTAQDLITFTSPPRSLSFHTNTYHHFFSGFTSISKSLLSFRSIDALDVLDAESSRKKQSDWTLPPVSRFPSFLLIFFLARLPPSFTTLAFYSSGFRLDLNVINFIFFHSLSSYLYRFCPLLPHLPLDLASFHSCHNLHLLFTRLPRTFTAFAFVVPS